jgi:tRNA threonylcarbamoyladenosine biosynthesis protein TsaB
VAGSGLGGRNVTGDGGGAAPRGPLAAPRGPLLALDTATVQTTLAVGDLRGEVLAARSWPAARREEIALLEQLRALLEEAGLQPVDLGALIVGLGPGGFTGLRVGLATAKTLAWGLRIPIVGIVTPLALASVVLADPGAEDRLAVVQPAGPHDRYVTRVTRADSGVALLGGPLLAAPEALADALVAGEAVAAAGLPADEPLGVPALELGRRALDGLGAALLALGTRRLASGERDDPAALVPAYVTLPRGLPAAVGTGTWSPDLP